MEDRDMMDSTEVGVRWHMLGIKADQLRKADLPGEYHVVVLHSPRRGVMEEIRAIFRSRYARDAFVDRMVVTLA